MVGFVTVDPLVIFGPKFIGNESNGGVHFLNKIKWFWTGLQKGTSVVWVTMSIKNFKIVFKFACFERLMNWCRCHFIKLVN